VNRTTDKRQKHLAAGLTGLLADSYVLYNSTQTCHWNVEGPQFHSLHAMFEEQYGELAEAIDVIAERVRSLGFYTPGTLDHLTKLSRIQQPGELRDSTEMLNHLIEAHQQVVHRASELRGEAEDALDEATVDLLTERLRVHEKTLWMLRSQAGRNSTELTSVGEMARAS
jgi:starvation-inducible DNA-binding protein